MVILLTKHLSIPLLIIMLNYFLNSVISSWRNLSGLLIDIIRVHLSKLKQNLLMLTVSCVLVNTLHQNDGTWSPLLFRRSPEVGVARRAPNTMNRDEGAHHLSHVYDPLLATPTSGDRRYRRGDHVPSFWWSVLTRTHKTVNTSKFSFWFWQMNS